MAVRPAAPRPDHSPLASARRDAKLEASASWRSQQVGGLSQIWFTVLANDANDSNAANTPGPYHFSRRCDDHHRTDLTLSRHAELPLQRFTKRTIH
jgi:hypothetical protein